MKRYASYVCFLKTPKIKNIADKLEYFFRLADNKTFNHGGSKFTTNLEISKLSCFSKLNMFKTLDTGHYPCRFFISLNSFLFG